MRPLAFRPANLLIGFPPFVCGDFAFFFFAGFFFVAATTSAAVSAEGGCSLVRAGHRLRTLCRCPTVCVVPARTPQAILGKPSEQVRRRARMGSNYDQ